MKIGNIELKSDLFLGPMAGFSDYPFRILAKEYGAALTYTEMVSAKALYYGDKKTRQLLAREDDLCAVQLFGREPEIMAYAAKLMQDEGVKMLDINMGCPAPKITSNGEGSALLKEPELAVKVAESVKKAVTIPVTVKMRRGWNSCPDAAEKIAPMLDDIGIDAICIHPRTREQFYSGRADRSVIKRIKDKVGTKVIGNGDVTSYDEYVDMKTSTGADGVMIARAASERPWIFRECIEGRTMEMSLAEKIRLIRHHYELAVDFYGEYLAITQMRKQFHCYIKGTPGASRLKDEINRISTYTEVKSFLDNIERGTENAI